MSLWRRNTEKEKQNLQNDRERRNNILRAHETELHQLQLRETDLRSKLREKEALQKSVEAMQLEVASLTSQLKVTMSSFILPVMGLIAVRNWIFKF
jgi:DNA repair protein RAD50